MTGWTPVPAWIPFSLCVPRWLVCLSFGVDVYSTRWLSPEGAFFPCCTIDNFFLLILRSDLAFGSLALFNYHFYPLLLFLHLLSFCSFLLYLCYCRVYASVIE
jgi:hypothetical protein